MSVPVWPADPVDWPILSGPVLKVGILLAAVAALVLVIRPRRRWWLVGVPVCLGVVAVVITLALLTIEVWWKPFPDAIPPEVTFWGAVAVAGLTLAVARQFARVPWYARLGHLGLAAVVVVGGLLGINHYYGEFPDLRSTFGLQPKNVRTLESIPPIVATVPVAPNVPLVRQWKPPATMPAKGVLISVDIPGTVSHFQPNLPEWVYLPPAYLTVPRPRLPVLVLLSGQPGTARDWINGGQIDKRMDAWAEAHHGLAPIVVIPDYLGGPFRNPLCINSPEANVDTYLSVDVVDYVGRTFQANTDHRYWAIGGFSEGATCSLQMATYHPSVFPTFLSLSGTPDVWRGNVPFTISHYFGGNSAAYHRAQPLEIMKAKRFTHSAAAVFGADDDPHPQAVPVTVAACRAAGMTVFDGTVPGTHSWLGWGRETTEILPWLLQRWGLGT